MERIGPSEIGAFLRRYRWPGGRLRSIRLRHQGSQLNAEIVLSVREALRDLGATPKPVRLRLRLVGVEECRIQKRLGRELRGMTDLKLGFLDGLFWLNFDSWSLAAGETPGRHDFRASEAYLAARDLFREELPRRQA